MSPEERQLLSELFERVRTQANAPRDRDAENFIAEAMRALPYAPYFLAQATIMQDQALRAADQKIQELQAEIGQLRQQTPSAAPGAGGFLGGLFGGGRPAPQPQPGATPSPWGAPQQQQAYDAPPQQQAFAPPQPAPSPWGAPQAAQGGGFLHNALGAAAGVAGGVLLADSIRGLMSGGHGGGLFGGQGLTSQGLAGQGLTGQGVGGGETIVNNYFDKPAHAQDAPAAQTAPMFEDRRGNDPTLSDADFSGDDFSGGDFSGDDNFSSDV